MDHHWAHTPAAARAAPAIFLDAGWAPPLQEGPLNVLPPRILLHPGRGSALDRPGVPRGRRSRGRGTRAEGNVQFCETTRTIGRSSRCKARRELQKLEGHAEPKARTALLAATALALLPRDPHCNQRAQVIATTNQLLEPCFWTLSVRGHSGDITGWAMTAREASARQQREGVKSKPNKQT